MDRGGLLVDHPPPTGLASLRAATRKPARRTPVALGMVRRGFEPAALDIERREDELWGRIDENSIFVAEEQDERDLFLSCLPFDVFQGSAYAIDSILQM